MESSVPRAGGNDPPALRDQRSQFCFVTEPAAGRDLEVAPVGDDARGDVGRHAALPVGPENRPAGAPEYPGANRGAVPAEDEPAHVNRLAVDAAHLPGLDGDVQHVLEVLDDLAHGALQVCLVVAHHEPVVHVGENVVAKRLPHVGAAPAALAGAGQAVGIGVRPAEVVVRKVLREVRADVQPNAVRLNEGLDEPNQVRVPHVTLEHREQHRAVHVGVVLVDIQLDVVAALGVAHPPLDIAACVLLALAAHAGALVVAHLGLEEVVQRRHANVVQELLLRRRPADCAGLAVGRLRALEVGDGRQLEPAPLHHAAHPIEQVVWVNAEEVTKLLARAVAARELGVGVLQVLLRGDVHPLAVCLHVPSVPALSTPPLGTYPLFATATKRAGIADFGQLTVAQPPMSQGGEHDLRENVLLPRRAPADVPVRVRQRVVRVDAADASKRAVVQVAAHEPKHKDEPGGRAPHMVTHAAFFLLGCQPPETQRGRSRFAAKGKGIRGLRPLFPFGKFTPTPLARSARLQRSARRSSSARTTACCSS